LLPVVAAEVVETLVAVVVPEVVDIVLVVLARLHYKVLPCP
tara:strand:+ start:93 stop:215 length:123 start_codon:yes stop_codon:yes gene_type:complete